MARIGLVDFVGTRCQFNRTSDAKIFNGWIAGLVGRSLTVRASTQAAFAIEDHFRFEAYGDKMLATFAATLKEINNFHLMTDGLENVIQGSESKIITATSVEIRLHTDGDIRFSNSQQAVRFRVNHWPCTLTVNGQALQASVLDISRSGIGLTTRCICEPGSEVELEIQAPHGATRATGEVRYCRSNPEQPAEYRIGIQFSDMGRIDRMRWENEIRNSA